MLAYTYKELGNFQLMEKEKPIFWRRMTPL